MVNMGDPHVVALRYQVEYSNGVAFDEHSLPIEREFDSFRLCVTDEAATACDDANEACPFFPGAVNRLHWSFEDPSRVEGSEEERLEVFRSVRDRICERIEDDLVATDEVMPTS